MVEIEDAVGKLCVELEKMEQEGSDSGAEEKQWLCLPYYRYVKSIAGKGGGKRPSLHNKRLTLFHSDS